MNRSANTAWMYILLYVFGMMMSPLRGLNFVIIVSIEIFPLRGGKIKLFFENEPLGEYRVDVYFAVCVWHDDVAPTGFEFCDYCFY